MKWLTSFGVAVKRVMKNPLFLILLAFLCFCVLFFGSVERELKVGDVGVYLRDDDPEGKRLLNVMKDDGFVVYDSEETMRQAIRTEDIAVGIAIKKSMTERMQAGEMDGALVLYCMPTTSSVKLTSLRASAHLGQVYAPYLVARLAKHQAGEVTPEQVREYMDKWLASDAQFEVQMTDMDGKSMATASYSQNMIHGMMAVLLFCLFCLCTCTEKDGGYRNLHDRLGAKTAFFTVLLPSYAVKYAVSLGVTALAALACRWLYGTDVSGLVERCAIYLLFLCGVGGALYGLLYKFSRVQLYILILSLLSLGICPIFIDLGSFANLPEWIKLLLPPYFFYKIPEAPLACGIGAAAICVGGLWLLYQREKRVTPRTRV